MKSYYVYILASDRNGTIYVGVTNDLIRRLEEHISGDISDAFTGKYGVKRLVYYEETGSVGDAIAREKQLKNWKRSWKLELIESVNPDWNDLSKDL